MDDGRFHRWRLGIRVAVVAALLGAGAAVWLYAPVDAEMGPVQKLIYLHLPAAMASFAASLVVFVAGLGWLWTHDERWSRVGRAAAVATVGCCLVVLVTGMAWARALWGVWWTWSPRLTFTLVMCVLYAAYLLLPRRTLPWRERGAFFACIAFLDVPLVYLSIRLLPDVHPTALPLTAAMRLTLVPCLVAAGLFCADLIFSALRPGEAAGRGRALAAGRAG